MGLSFRYIWSKRFHDSFEISPHSIDFCREISRAREWRILCYLPPVCCWEKGLVPCVSEIIYLLVLSERNLCLVSFLPFFFRNNALFLLLALHFAMRKRQVFLYVFPLLPQIGSFKLSHWLSSGQCCVLGPPHSPLCSMVRLLPFCLARQRATRK